MIQIFNQIMREKNKLSVSFGLFCNSVKTYANGPRAAMSAKQP